jgi:hypothetical protein
MKPPRPIEKFAQAVGKCSAEVSTSFNMSRERHLKLTFFVQAAVYGKCVVEDYNSVHKDKCAKEFLKLKDCYLVRRNVPNTYTSRSSLRQGGGKREEVTWRQ